MEPGLPHQGKKPDGFQTDRLAPGIGAGNDQQREILSQGYGDGYHCPGIQKGMPAVSDMDPSFFIQDRAASVHGQGKMPSCKNKIKVGQTTVIGTDFFDISCSFLT